MAKTSRADAPYQPVLRRRDSAWRYIVVLAATAVQLSYVQAYTQASRFWWIVEISLGIVALLALPFRRRWPLPIAIGIMAATTVSSAAFGPMLLATASLATRRRWREIAPLVLVAAASIIGTYYIPFCDCTDEIDISTSLPELLVWSIGLLAILVGWGLYVGSRRELFWNFRERAERLEREQDIRTEQARDAERAQIAREMHDVLAHRISQISMQAGAIAFRTDLDADDLRASAQQLQTSANAALDDLRVVLGVLRDPDSGGPLDAPQPKATDIEAMVTTAQADGMRIQYRENIQAGLDNTIGRTLYRITQECITNARKHAGGATLVIDITGSPDNGVDFIASNPLPLSPAPSPLPRSGFGLIGLAERIELAGGTLTTERNHHSFTVTCHLPWHPAPATQPHEYAS